MTVEVFQPSGYDKRGVLQSSKDAKQQSLFVLFFGLAALPHPTAKPSAAAGSHTSVYKFNKAEREAGLAYGAM